MKKFICILISVVLVVSAGYLCSEYFEYFRNPVLKELPIYRNREYYSEGFWQDYTDYAKCFYKNISEEDLQSAESFNKMTEQNIKEILCYIDGYESFINGFGTDGVEGIKEVYDFDKSVIDTNDYFHIIGGDSYTFFTLFYFDTESQILYYFHNSI